MKLWSLLFISTHLWYFGVVCLNLPILLTLVFNGFTANDIQKPYSYNSFPNAFRFMDWKKLSKAIGPLRYQMSECDCVPTTIVNALLVVRKKRLKPKLLHLIWSVSLDFNKEGTGFVSSQLLAHVLQSWFDRALADGYEARKTNLISEIIEGDDVHLNQNNRIAYCLNSGGVACLTTENGDHYSLLLAKEDNYYLGFDPWWREIYSGKNHSNNFGKYYGIVNVQWTHDELLKELKRKNNKWIHLIYPS